MRLIYLASNSISISSSNFDVTILDMTKLDYYYNPATANRISTWAIIMMISAGVIVTTGICIYCVCCKGKGSSTNDDNYKRVVSK